MIISVWKKATKPIKNTIKNIIKSAIKVGAACGRFYWARGRFLTVLAIGISASVLPGCSILDKPMRLAMYDFGPGELANASASLASVSSASSPASTAVTKLPALALDDIASPAGALDNTSVLYRLAYVDAQQLRAYSQARWSSPPAQLIRQRLRARLSQRRSVFNAREGLALNRSQSAVLPPVLRLELEEFSQVFSSPQASVGLIRLRATLIELSPGGEKLMGQRTFAIEQPASSADAAGGVRALTLATDAAIAAIDQWLQQNQTR